MKQEFLVITGKGLSVCLYLSLSNTATIKLKWVSQIQGSRLLQLSLKRQSLSFIAWLPQHCRIPFADVHQALCYDYISNSGLKIRLCSGNTNRVGRYRPFSIFLPGYLNLKPSHEHLHNIYPYHLNRFALTSTLSNVSLTDHSFKFSLM